jgi:hypothetical protein
LAIEKDKFEIVAVTMRSKHPFDPAGGTCRISQVLLSVTGVLQNKYENSIRACSLGEHALPERCSLVN